MKQLIACDSSVVHIASFTPEELAIKFFGVETSGGGRGFVTCRGYNDGEYRILTRHHLSVGNGYWTSIEASTLREFLVELMKLPEFKVFVFDDFLELAKWLTEVDKV